MYHDFYYDFKNIHFLDMYSKISSLPQFREILQMRSKFFRNEKMNIKERKAILKLMNEEQLEEIGKNNISNAKEQAFSIMNSMSSVASKIQEKNKRKMQERGLNGKR